jgi:hypothetical protein
MDYFSRFVCNFDDVSRGGFGINRNKTMAGGPVQAADFGRRDFDGQPRYFKGELAGILLYNRALSENEQKSAAHWLF